MVGLADGVDDGLEDARLEEAGAVERGTLVGVEVGVSAAEMIVDEVSRIGTCEVYARVVPAKVS